MMLPIHSYGVENASTARLVNVYVEKLPEGSKGQFVLKRSQGIRSVNSTLAGHGRGLHEFNGELYAVAGSTLYRISPGHVSTTIGNIAGSGLVSMASNMSQLAISHSGSLSVLEGSLTQIYDSDRPTGPIDFLDNYIIGVKEGTGQFVCSALADATDYDGLDFATAESSPDNLLTLKADHSSAILFGTKSTEIWDNAGGSGFPFIRNVNGVIELGIIGQWAATTIDNTVFWVANDLTLRRLNGPTPVRVSQHGAERQWRTYSRTDDCELDSYTIDGHLTVVIHFPDANKTWIYDVTTQEMSEREGARYEGWDVAALCPCYGRIYVQRRSTGEIGVLDAASYQQWGEQLRAEWAYQPIYEAGSRITVNALRLGISTGLGDDTTLEPTIQLSLSKEGGRAGTFRPWPSRLLGKKGKFNTRVEWQRFGEMRDGVFSLSIADPVPLTVWDTTIS